MKSKVFLSFIMLFVAVTATFADVEINETNFPDENFRNWILQQNYGSDGVLTTTEIADVTEMYVQYNNIQSLQGIEFFTALTILNCSGNQLTSLDVSKNTALTTLECYQSHLTSLNASGCTALTRLECYENQITSLDVSGCMALTYMNCYGNQLTSLDVSKNTALTSLNCSRNQFSSLDVSKNTALKTLNCCENQLTSLDLSKNTSLTSFDCYSNQIKDEGMDALVASLPIITSGYSWEGQMEVSYYYNEKNLMTITQVATAKSKGWTPLYYNVTNHEWQEYAGYDPAKTININETNFPDENFRNWILDQDYGSDGVLNDAEIANITEIYVTNENIISLKGIEFFTMLTHLNCNSNQLTSLDVSKNTKLMTLACSNNQLTSLDLSKNTNLKSLNCSRNDINGVAMDALIESMPAVTNDGSWECGDMDVIANYREKNIITIEQVAAAKAKGWTPKLYDGNGNWQEYAGYDPSKTIEINESNFPDENFRSWLLSQSYGEDGIVTDVEILTTRSLYPSSSSIDSLKGIEIFTELTSLSCDNNNIKSIDLSYNTKLTSLYCYNNLLTSLDLSKNTKLTYLNCYGNQIKGEDMDALVAGLPTISNENSWDGQMLVINYEKEGNEMTSKQVEIAKEKGWKPKYAMSSHTWLDYEGNDHVAEGIEINETNFPDVNFRSFLKEQTYGTDGVLTAAEISTITSLWVTYRNIQDLKGIEYFTGLSTLSCSGNQLTSLDVSKNISLGYLYCNNNQLTSLDLSKNTALTSLDCCSNRIKGEAMDALIASLPTITSGSSWDGRMQVINNSNERNMMTIDQVAVAKAKGWTPQYNAGSGYSSDWKEYAGLDPTKIIEINETNFPDAAFRSWLLTQSYGEDGLLTDTEILTTTSMSVYGYYNSKVQSLKGIEFFTELTSLSCTNNSLTTLDLSKNTKLTKLDCYNNQISGEGMDALIASLPTVSGGEMKVIYNYSEGNDMTTAQASAAKAKGWIPQKYDDSSWTWIEYGGMDINPSLLEKFPDTNFCKYLLSQPYGADGDITDEEMATVTRIDVPNRSIKSLKGIEYFTALEMLSCNNNQLTELDLSKNTALTGLWCYNNQLTSLDLSKNTLLTDLGCSKNQLKSLNLSGCKKLVEVGVNDNQLTTLDLSGCKDMVEFGCENNQLTSLNLSGCTSLDRLYCYNNQFKGAAMDALIASMPTVSSGRMRVLHSDDLYIGGNEMTLEQVIAAKAKGWIPYYSVVYEWTEYIPNDPSGVGIAINETNFPDENFRNYLLYTSYGYDEVLTNLEASMVNTIDVAYFEIQTLKGIEFFTELKELDCYKNQLTSLDLSQNTKLVTLECGNNQLTALDLSNNTALIEMDCDNNQLTSLDLSKNIALTGLSCTKNQISSLDLSNNRALTWINCYSNQMSSLELPHNSDLVKLRCYDNLLTSLDVSNNPKLKSLNCYNNKLASINVSGCTALKSLDCYQNQLKGTEIDAIIENLPVVDEGASMYFIYNEGEGNEMTRSQVDDAFGKMWAPMYYGKSEYGYNTWMVYYGSDDDTLRGDVNGDGTVNGTDIQAVINLIVDGEYDEKADVNEDGTVNGTDIQEVINIIVDGE